jgi:hypothetical protein
MLSARSMLTATTTFLPAAELVTNLRERPALTLYREGGLANLNGEATRLLSRNSDSLLLLAPAGPRARWVLLPATDGLSGEIRLIGRVDRGNLRFRAPSMALALFAALPEAQAALRMVLEPSGTGWQLVAQ